MDDRQAPELAANNIKNNRCFTNTTEENSSQMDLGEGQAFTEKTVKCRF